MDDKEKQALLEEARKKYPIGTVFKPIVKGHLRNEYTIEKELVWETNDIISHYGIPAVYNGEWAEIVKVEEKPSRILVFNDIYVGDIVVSHKVTNKNIDTRKVGDIFRVLEGSKKGVLYYIKDRSQSNTEGDWRKATFEEIEAYNKGIKNINDIPKKAVFEVGKWYKRPFIAGHNKSTFKTYFKCCKVENDDWWASDEISEDGTFYSTNSNGTKTKDGVVPIDISEIQQYLPDGHVDKIVEKYTSKYWKVYNKDSKYDFINKYKVPIKEGESGTLEGYISGSQYYHSGGGSSVKNGKFTLPTEDEIKWLEACIKANKFIPKEEALKPSIPEYVECIIKFFVEHQIGKIYKTDKFPNELKHCENYTWKKIIETPDYSKHFKPSTKEAYEAQNKPKVEWVPSVGDWVLLGNYCDTYNGKIVKITKIKDGYYHFEPNLSEYANFVKSMIVRKAEEHEIPKVMEKEPELIEGQWYTAEYENSGKIYIFHFLGKKGDYFHVDKQVTSTGSVERDDWPGYAGMKSWTNLKLANMEEVYKYFPEERPKEEENWSYRLTIESEQILKKWLISLNISWSANVNAWYGIKDGSPHYGSWSNSWGKVLTTEEFYKKIGHVTEKSMETYKEGDWVIATGNIHKGNSYLGKLVTFRSTNFDSLVDYDAGGQTFGSRVYSNIIRKALPHEIPSKSMNTYGLKVGDKIAEKILKEWCAQGPNTWWGQGGSTWKSGNNFSSSESTRTIISFGTKDGFGTIHFSDCDSTFFLKLEGFKEFMDNFNKPKLEKGKYYSWKGADGTRYMQFVEKIDETTKTSYYRWEKEGKNQNEHLNGTDIYPLKDSIFKEVTEQEAKGTKTSELTSLPEKWCIAVTKENAKVLGKWRSSGYAGNVTEEDAKGYVYYEGYLGDRGYWIVNKLPDCTEITFEQFKKWVLKSEPVKEQVMENLNDRWVKILKDNPWSSGAKIGQYYQIDHYAGGDHKLKGAGYISSNPMGNYELMPIGWTPEIEKKYTYEVVSCETQEQWDFVLSKFNPLGLEKRLWDKGRCITFGGTTAIGTHSTKSWFEHTRTSKIYSFEEWCNKFGHVFSPKKEEWKIGDWAYVLKESRGGYKNPGDVFKVIKVQNSFSIPCLYFDDYSCVTADRVRKALSHEIPLYDTIYNKGLVDEMVHFSQGYDQLRPKKKGFDEKEHLSKPYNQMLEIKIKKTNKQFKKQLL